MADGRDNPATQGGVQSLDAALVLLRRLAEAGGPQSLSDLASDCGMPPSKAHRYLASFQAAGLAVQKGRSGRYDLGMGALEIGLSAMARHDAVALASDGLGDLREETGMTVLLSVWGGGGATVVRWERAAAPVVTSMGLGTVLPLLTSATGRVFLGWAPRAPLATALAAEAARLRASPDLAPEIDPSEEGIEGLRAGLRARGFASVDGRYIPGLVAAAAPILDWQGEAAAAVSLIGTRRRSVEDGAPQVRALMAFCAARSPRPPA